MSGTLIDDANLVVQTTLDGQGVALGIIQVTRGDPFQLLPLPLIQLDAVIAAGDELDQAAAMGFRVVMGSPTSGAELAVLLERSEDGTEPYEYRLLATTRTSTMHKELNEAGSEGFRLLPTTGHTPGHVSVVIESAGATALITGDATHSPIQFPHPELAAWRVDHDAVFRTPQ